MHFSQRPSVTVLCGCLYLVACGGDDGPTSTGGGDSGNSQEGGSSTGNSGTGAAADSGTGQTGSQDAGTCQTEADVSSPSTSASDACRAFCVAEDHCNAMTTVEDCQDYRSCAKEDSGSEACVAAAKVYWDCLRAQSDICSPEACCEGQADAVFEACNP